MKIGIVSVAHPHAHSYARALQHIEGVQLAGVAHPVAAEGEPFAEQYGTTYYSDYLDLLDTDIEAVIITSENVKHREHVEQAARKGKHILCEKPLATTLADAEQMIQSCKEAHVLLQTAFPVRFSTPIVQGKKMIERGELGELIAVKATNRGKNPQSWFVDVTQSGGGAVMDHTVHVVDVLRWYMKAEVVEVYAEIGAALSEGEIDDSGVLTMTFDNGVFATLDCSWSRNPSYPTWGDVTLELIGSQGTLFIDAFAQKVNVYSETADSWEFWGDDMNLGLIKNFVQAVRAGRQEASITGEDGMKALAVALGAYQSAQQLKPVDIKSFVQHAV